MARLGDTNTCVLKTDLTGSQRAKLVPVPAYNHLAWELPSQRFEKTKNRLTPCKHLEWLGLYEFEKLYTVPAHLYILAEKRNCALVTSYTK